MINGLIDCRVRGRLNNKFLGDRDKNTANMKNKKQIQNEGLTPGLGAPAEQPSPPKKTNYIAHAVSKQRVCSGCRKLDPHACWRATAREGNPEAGPCMGFGKQEVGL